MIFHENCLLANESHEISYLIFSKIRKDVFLLSAAVVIATLRVKLLHASRKFCCLLMIFANNLDPDQA